MRGFGEKTAERLSLIFSAPSLAFIAALIFTLFSPIGIGPFLTPTASILLGTLFLSVLPIAPIAYYAWKGTIDIDITDRRKRPKFFAMSLVGYSLGAVTFGLLNATSMMVLSLAYIFVTLSVALISLFWKVSVHTTGIAGPVTGLTYVFGWAAAPLYLLLLPIGWARLKLKAHTILQLIAGIIVAFFVTLAVYLVFYPAPPMLLL
jgi:membrane-associated phospholipid phosphatase